jgi:hypothetical protein
MGRRDLVESFANTAFGIVAGSVVMTTPISNYDIASATVPTNDATMILMDGASTTTGWVTPKSVLSSSPTTLYMAQQTPKQLISAARNTIQITWFAYIDNNQWSTLNSSYSTQNSIIRQNANIIVNQNPGNQLLVTRRQAMFTQLDSTKSAINQQNSNLATARTMTLLTRISEFLAAAP